MSPRSTLRRGLPLAAAALAVTATAACSPSSSGTPEPTGRAPATSQTTKPGPTIDSPKNLQAVTDSCELLTQQQLDQLGMQAEPERKESMLGIPSCDWSGDDFAMTIAPDTRTGGIDQLYKSNTPGQGFQKSQVKGYPAAWIDKQSILCRVEVGVSKDSKFSVSWTSYQSDPAKPVKPCESGEKIAAMVLQNIPDA